MNRWSISVAMNIQYEHYNNVHVIGRNRMVNTNVMLWQVIPFGAIKKVESFYQIIGLCTYMSLIYHFVIEGV